MTSKPFISDTLKALEESLEMVGSSLSEDSVNILSGEQARAVQQIMRLSRNLVSDELMRGLARESDEEGERMTSLRKIRLLHALLREGVSTYRLCRMTDEEILLIDGVGEKGLKYIRTFAPRWYLTKEHP